MQPVISLNALISFLSRVDGFREIPEGELKALIVPMISIAEYFPGQLVIEQGTIGSSLFILYAGDARIDVVKEDGRQFHFKLNEGEVVGEMSLISKQPRRADVVALSQSTFLVLDIVTFQTIMASHWRVTKAFAGLIGKRIKNSFL